MWWEYLKAVLGRALWFTPRWTDGLQVLTASALPGVARFAGVKMPDAIGNDALAYIGAATLAFIFIRLIWAPYALWKEQSAEIGGLKLELSKPERIELETIGKRRAKARLKLTTELTALQWETYAELYGQRSIYKRLTKMFRRCAQAGTSDSFNKALHLFIIEIGKIAELTYGTDEHEDASELSKKYLNWLIANLHGKLTDENLALLLPPSTEAERLP